MVAVVMPEVVVVKVPVLAGVVVSMAVELLVIGVWDDVATTSVPDGGVTNVVVALECVVPVAYFLVLEVLSDLVVEALAVGIGVEVLDDVNVNVSAAVMTALEFPMPIPEEEFSC